MNEQLTIDLAKEVSTDLSSRGQAADVRHRVASYLDDLDGVVIVDLRGVRSMSESFADELFGVLAERKGEEWFRNKLTLREASPGVRQSILRAIHERLSRPV